MRWLVLMGAGLWLGGCDTADEFQKYENSAVCSAPAVTATTLSFDERIAIKEEVYRQWEAGFLLRWNFPAFRDVARDSSTCRFNELPGGGLIDGPTCPVKAKLITTQLPVAPNGMKGEVRVREFRGMYPQAEDLGVVSFTENSTAIASAKTHEQRFFSHSVLKSHWGTTELWSCTTTNLDAGAESLDSSGKVVLRRANGNTVEIRFTRAPGGDSVLTINGHRFGS